MNTEGISDFEPTRLIVARERRSVTQRCLSESLGVDVRTIKGYEGGTILPSKAIISAFSRALSYPEAFFLDDPLETLPVEAASFRALSKASAKVRNRAVASGTLAVSLFYPYLSDRFELPNTDLPDLREFAPSEAAQALRSQWGLGQRPVQHMIGLLESRGIRVFSLSEDCDAIDAFSIWWDSTPFVFLNTRKTAERSIFDAAHELGHLVLHRHGSPQGLDAESQADRFASSFLLPEAAIRAEAPRNVTVASVTVLKQRWRASAAAIARRLHDLELMTDHHYTQFNKHLSYRGRSLEPSPLSRETSVVLRKALAALGEEGTDLKTIAAQLHLPLGELRALTFGFQSVTGGATAPGGISPRPQLRLVD